eukprot:10593176-Lingulodinium_polyedra.AAC.1
MAGLKRFKNVCAIRDIFSGLDHAFPTKSRTAEDTIECFKTFVGPKEKTIFKLYSDVGREVVACAKEFH